MNTQVGKGCIRLFHVAGISVLLHWSWLLVAIFEITQRADTYPSLAWNVAEYLVLFGIVLLHELGHAFACRMVGGTAEQIILWPLGGIAYVNPPLRPGAVLWSISAGPWSMSCCFPPQLCFSCWCHWPQLRGGSKTRLSTSA